MKNTTLHYFTRKATLLFCFILLGFTFQNNVFGQLAVYPLRSSNAVNNNTPNGEAQVSLTNPNVEALKMIYGTNMEQANHNSTGVRMRTEVNGNTAPWPTIPTDGYGFDIPLSPRAGYDMTITGITVSTGSGSSDFDVDAPGTVFYIAPYFQVDGAGPWFPLAPVQTITGINQPINFGAINETFYNTHKYTIRFYVYSSNGSSDSKSDYIRLINLVFNGNVYQPPSKAVTVSTLTATKTGKYTATATGKYDFNGTEFYLVKQSGVIWAPTQAALAALDTSAITKTTNGSAGVINSNITGLTAGTDYWVKAYIVTQFGIQYGTALPFKTDAATAPVVTTNPVSNVLSNKATGGGVITDSGGIPISSKGLVWNLNGGATLASNSGKLVLNGGSAPFSDLMKGLAPNTRYCYRAYATNSLGTSYGNDVCFTTGAPVPVLVAVPGTLDFGENFYGGNAITVTYSLSGSSLSPASGNITITVPAASGFKISLTSNQADFKTTLTLPYTGGVLPKTPIFVQLPTGTYGSFTGVITHSGGGVAAADADVVNVKGSIVASPDDVTNRGTDFWLGFGYQESMKRKTSDAAITKMSVYITAGDQPATVVVEIPGVPSWVPQTINVPANSVRIVTNFPSGDDVSPNANISSTNDARLFFTGTTNRGIHVYSTNGALVSVWQHIYANNNSAGGSMIFPTNTWNSSYTVQSYAGITNNQYACNSFFYVIANENGTEIEFTPSNDILSSAAGNIFSISNSAAGNIQYFKGQTYKVTLNRGQVFTAMGAINGNPSSGGASLDLSGTTIRATSCEKKIAVFCGNGRVITKVNSCTPSDGSDNLIQQMFPTVAWGTRYLTVPTKGMEYNLFRIYVKDPATVVKVNGVSPGALINGLYYETEGNGPKLITSDLPINVTQFILAGSCKGANVGNSANGDPEMIILSPIEQAVTKTVVYSARLQKNGTTPDNGTNASYINVILKKEGLTSFKIDGIDYNSATRVDTATSSTSANPFNASLCLLKDAFKPHPQDANYLYAKFRVKSDAVHVLSSSEPFNSIAYGMGDGESYGYNAGTSIKNLSSYKISVNPEGTDSSSTVVRTCKDLPITLKIAFPYNPSLVDSIMWEPNDARVTPNTRMKGALSGGKAEYNGTVDIEGRTYYIYTAPTTYTFSENALYRVKATAYGTFASDCPGQDPQTILVNVGQDNLNLAATPACNNPTVPFTADTVPMVGTNILSWKWEFGDGSAAVTTGTLTPQSHTFPSSGGTVYTVKLTTKNTVGCYSTDSLQIDFGGGLTSAFTISDDAVCANENVTFTDASFGTGTSGQPNKWDWDFGDGKTSNLQAPPAQNWTSAGIKTIALTVTTPIGCVKTFKDTVTVEATPVSAIDANPTFVCLGTDASYKDASTISIGTIATWAWTFDDGGTSSSQNPVYKWATAGNHTATLKVTSAGGCVATNTATHTINVNALPTAGFKYELDCTTRIIKFTDTSNGFGVNITKYTWDFGDGQTDNTNNPNPQHTYAAAGTYNISLIVENANGCVSVVPANKQITIDVSPLADFTLPGNTCLPSASPAFTNGTTISDGSIATVTYLWEFSDGGTSTDINPTHLYTTTGSFTVKLTATSAKGCTNSVSKPYSAIFAAPTAVITAPAGVCLGNDTEFKSDQSTTPGSTAAVWAWDFGGGVTRTEQNPVYAYPTAGNKTVTLVITTAAGCVSQQVSKSFDVNLSPVPNFTFSNIRCEDSVITFNDASTSNATGGITEYKWNFGDGSAQLVQTALAPATHTFATAQSFNVSLELKNANGCLSAAAYTVPVVINPNPVSGFTVSDICIPGGAAQFTQTATVSSGSVTAWDWSFGEASIPNSSSPTPQVNYPTGGEYPVTVKATSDQGCAALYTETVKAYNVPTPLFGVTEEAKLCSNLPVNITDSSKVNGYGSVSKIEIYWDFLANPTAKEVINAPSPNSTYSHLYTEFGIPAFQQGSVMIRAFSGNGCTADYTKDIVLLAAPKVQFAEPAAVCQEAQPFNLTGASDIYGLAGSGEYSGNGITTSPEFSPAQSGFGSQTIRYTYTTQNGCTDFEEKQLVVNPTPVIDFGGPEINVLEGDVMKLAPAISYGATYLWSPSTYLNNPASATPSGMPTNDITYTLAVTSDKGCFAETSVFVRVVRNYIVPNTFTPNNDNIHDSWEISNLKYYPSVRVRVYNRSGQLVFESIGYNTPWDGKYKGKDMPFGTYYYVIETGGGRPPRTGYVTILK